MRCNLPTALCSAVVCLGVIAPVPAFAQAFYLGDGGRRSVSTTGTIQTTPASTPRPGALGGGFIEFLVTGRDPSAAAHSQSEPGRLQRQASPRAATQPDVDPFSGLSAVPPGRQLAAVQPRHDFERPIERVLDPRFQRQEVAYDGPHRPGTVVIDTPSKFLYLVQENGRALRYGIGVGRPGFEWAGVKSITRKAEWPDWTPPAAMLKRRPDLPRFMPGGPENPMGARAMYLGSSLYRIHGTNEPHTIGQAVSSGCIRMTNDDVTDLYNRVRVGMRVIVI